MRPSASPRRSVPPILPRVVVVVLVGRTCPVKTHLAIAIGEAASGWERDAAVDFVNQLEAHGPPR